MKVEIWHNIMWSRYKAVIFSELYALISERYDFKIYQIAETDHDRVGLSSVDYSIHKYPYVNLFQGAYSAIPKRKLLFTIFSHTLKSDADLTVVAGYSRLEYWLQAFLLLIRRRKFAFFCDSTIHDQKQKFFKSLLKRVFFYFSSGAFCYGKRSAQYLMHYGMDPSKIFVDCQAAASGTVYDTEMVHQQRLAVTRQPDAPRYLYVGRLAKEKRIGTLLQAFTRTLKSYPAAKLVLVGSGPMAQDLKNQAQALQIDNSVEFTGPKSGDDLWREFLEADCFILPSYSEPWGLVVNEALSLGCPVIVSDRCGCVPELVEGAQTGFVFNCDDIDDLTSKMIEIPQAYPTTVKTIDACLNRISLFTPVNAAKSMLFGITNILNKT